MEYEKFNEQLFNEYKEVGEHFKYMHRIYGGWVKSTVFMAFGKEFYNDYMGDVWVELYYLFDNPNKLKLFENIRVFKFTLDNVIRKVKLYGARDTKKHDNFKTRLLTETNIEYFNEINTTNDLVNLIKKYITTEEFELLHDFYYLELTNDEIGKKYNKPKTTIRDRRIKIQKKLKELLLDDGYDFDDLI